MYNRVGANNGCHLYSYSTFYLMHLQIMIVFFFKEPSNNDCFPSFLWYVGSSSYYNNYDS